MELVFACFVLLLGFTCQAKECRESCSTWSPHTSGSGRSFINCSIEQKQCQNLGVVAKDGKVPVAPKHVEKDWYLYQDLADKKYYIALNFSWSPIHNSNILYLKYYKIEIYLKGTPSNGLLESFYFCFQGAFDFNKHILAEFYYDCFGRGSRHEIKPGETYLIYIMSFPVPGPSADHTVLELEITIPHCDQKGMAKEAHCMNEIAAGLSFLTPVCSNNTVILKYNVPEADLAPASLLICYAKEYDPHYTDCEKQAFFDDLPISSDFYSITLPKELSLKSNLSFAIFGADHFAKHYKKYAMLCQEEQNYTVLVIVIVCIVVSLVFTFLVTMVCFRQKAKDVARLCCPRQKDAVQGNGLNHNEEPPQSHPLVTQEVPSNAKRKVLVTFVEDNIFHRNVILAFCSYLHRDLGFDVIMELWQKEEIFKDCSTWIDNVMNKCDKIIVVWSPAALKLWEKQKAGDGVSIKQPDLFTPFLNMIRNDLLYGRNKGKHYFTYFGYCDKSVIPESFREKCPCSFELMKQFNELYFRLINEEMFKPGAFLEQTKAKAERYYDTELNEYGCVLKDQIGAMYEWIANNPNWYEDPSIDEPTFTVHSVDQTRLLSESLCVNKLNIEPPPPMAVGVSANTQTTAKPLSHNVPVRPAAKKLNVGRNNYIKNDTPCDPLQQKPLTQSQKVLPKRPSGKRVPCENAETSKDIECPVLQPLNVQLPREQEDSGFSTHSAPLSDDDSTINPSSFYFDEAESFDISERPQLAPIERSLDPYQLLASLND